MRVETNLKAGAVIQNAQDQAEQFFQKTDVFLEDASQKVGQAAGVAAQKLNRTWKCVLYA